MLYVKIISGIICLPLLLPFLLLSRLFFFIKANKKPNILFGTTPIFVLPELASTLRHYGYKAYSGAVKDVDFKTSEDFDIYVNFSASPNFFIRWILGGIEAIYVFITSLFKVEVYCLYFEGGFLRRTLLSLAEPFYLKIAGKKLIYFPYGADSWAVSRIPDKRLKEALLKDYPSLANKDKVICQKLDIFSFFADHVIGCLAHNMVLHRADSLMLTCYGINLEKFEYTSPKLTLKETIIFHAPNHRHCKGTQFLIEAVKQLNKEGYFITLDLVEKKSREETLKKMKNADIVVDQLLMGYGITALEAMAFGKIVISGKNWHESLKIFENTKSYNECPVIWSSPETIKSDISLLIKNKQNWEIYSKNSKRFIQNYADNLIIANLWQDIINNLK